MKLYEGEQRCIKVNEMKVNEDAWRDLRADESSGR